MERKLRNRQIELAKIKRRDDLVKLVAEQSWPEILKRAAGRDIQRSDIAEVVNEKLEKAEKANGPYKKLLGIAYFSELSGDIENVINRMKRT